MELFLGIFGALFSVMNPFGTVPVFVGLTKEHTKLERNKIAFWASVNVLIILLISFFAGKLILSIFGTTLDSLKIAGGLIIVSSGFALLTGEFSKHKVMKKMSVGKNIERRSELKLTLRAIPRITGPGTSPLLIAYNQEFQQWDKVLIILGAILLSAICIYLVLKSSFFIVKSLGASGINALSRIIGFIVIAIGIEFIVSAVINVLHIG